MYKDFNTKRTNLILNIEKNFFGLGFSIDFGDSIYTPREVLCSIRIDFFFIRFWMDIFKK
jgi:hypothetical protein